jgi:high-affinity nickel-transport protein
MGFVLGLKHATDADHVVAITTFLGSENRLIRSAWIGFFWGLGHTVALMAAGTLVLYFRGPYRKILLPVWNLALPAC